MAAHTGGGYVDLEALANTLRMDLPSNPFAVATSPELSKIEAALDGAPVLTGEIQFLPPISRPGKLVCMARNYLLHAEETGSSLPVEPIYFSKASTTLIGHQQPIIIPPGIGRVDPEAELAVVIGKRAKGVSRGTALEHVAGYACFNDVTARDVQSRDTGGKHPWFRSKSYDTFGPLGPYLVTASELADPHCLSIRLTVNGEVRQESNTAMMAFDIPAIIAAASLVMTLEPGDVIATGTPEGIAPIHPGDVVCVEVQGLGCLTNPVLRQG
jgi:2-keto-4-pentenoate hydratase/2-oxohepta-3-ene-1,7-dioic acid hydratase in catechol pathway